MASSNHLYLTLFAGSKKEIQVELLTLKKADLIIRALNHKLRLQIIRLLHDKEELTVTEIYVKLRLEQSVASQHLALLRRAGIVETRREGKFIFYSINTSRIEEIHKLSKALVGQR
ncbi:MAG: metalloregulator ArsR/SmtB family transcription factor [Chitinophagaceae bacterium]|jgi:DNA-binding transcriptional ArsR family regulator|nr:metalloregulator ArsR/SmtB family transcription factor [Chitinophagaceae bacterium]